MKKNTLKLLVLFLVSYVSLYFLGVFTPLHDWGFTFDFGRLDYMYFLLPITGFFLMYYTIPFLNNFFGDNTATKWFFPIIFFIVSLIAFFTALYFYFANIVSLSNANVNPVELFDFWQQLFDSAFFVFVLSAILGWISFMIIHKPALK
jgi:hypothetical protein